MKYIYQVILYFLGILVVDVIFEWIYLEDFVEAVRDAIDGIYSKLAVSMIITLIIYFRERNHRK